MPIDVDVREALYKKVDNFSEKELDGLPHGAIQLDPSGKILKFNAYESALSNLAKEAVVGKNFFKDVAPCTDVQEFHGRFKKGVAEKKLHEKFRYHFAFKQQPRDVIVTLFFSDPTNSVWVFVQPQ
jgi:photoactive yellow protein